MSAWIELFGGGLFLYLGAEWFVGGASALALALRVPQLLIGLTVVAYGTSAPEVIVGIQAARAGHGDVALGNVVGSNIANIGLIMGIAALVCPARVNGDLRKRELPVLLASTAVLPLLLLDGTLARWEAGALLLLALLYTAWMMHTARRASTLFDAGVDAAVTVESTRPGLSTRASPGRAAGIAVLGLAVLLGGGTLFVEGAVDIARTLGMSERLVGLTIVAVGTSLPELITSIVAARRGHSDLAIGNVVGSNIFNVLLCLGTAGLAGSVGASLHSAAVDLGWLFAMTGLLALLIRRERTITRVEGGMALALYAAFTIVTVMKG